MDRMKYARKTAGPHPDTKSLDDLAPHEQRALIANIVKTYGAIAAYTKVKQMPVAAQMRDLYAIAVKAQEHVDREFAASLAAQGV